MLTEKTHLTPAEYLALERQSQERHEYYGGELRLMAGASRKHNIIRSISLHFSERNCAASHADRL
jgi:Uma2 family endonuclease